MSTYLVSGVTGNAGRRFVERLVRADSAMERLAPAMPLSRWAAEHAAGFGGGPR
ncbi:hypothetical protein [Microbispora sp. H10885]|uniref:hypothetical protein n=1 Tax=Microbispora sp. H10885 TaxID=2729110 RepID=UPI0016040E16|nr:hypothetical protein [Microbispora sp. H10885]